MNSVKPLANKVAVVTASTKGIGYAIAKRLGRSGASIVVSSRKKENVESAVNALKLEGVQCQGTVAHVGSEADRKHLINFALEHYGQLDILVSNAAANPHYGDLMSVSEALWEKMLSLNVKSAFLLAKEAMPHLEKSGRGNIVIVSSVAGYNPIEGIGAYSVMKTALLGLNRTLSQSMAHRGIRVNAIAPGVIRTDFSKALTSAMESGDGGAIDRLIPMERFGEADECAGAVCFLVGLHYPAYRAKLESILSSAKVT